MIKRYVSTSSKLAYCPQRGRLLKDGPYSAISVNADGFKPLGETVEPFLGAQYVKIVLVLFEPDVSHGRSSYDARMRKCVILIKAVDRASSSCIGASLGRSSIGYQSPSSSSSLKGGTGVTDVQ